MGVCIEQDKYFACLVKATACLACHQNPSTLNPDSHTCVV